MFKRTINSLVFIASTTPALSYGVALSQACPTEFHGIALPVDSKQCRVFGVKKPSALSFFIVDSPENIFLQFEEQLTTPKSDRHGEMLSLVSEQGDYRVYVFKDGQGTQVNIRAE